MIEFLKSKPYDLPTAITVEAPMDEDEGTLTANFPAGELFLTSSEGESFRLSWNSESKQKPTPRTLPAGKYTLRTYRIQREHEGVEWHVSATAPKIQVIEVIAGQNVIVKVNEGITITSGIKGHMGSMNIVGAPRVGLSIYRDQKRIPIDYRVLSKDGEQLAKGSMRYG